MTVTKRDTKGTQMYVERLGMVTMYHDVVDHEYQRKRIKYGPTEIIGDYFYENEKAVFDVMNKLKNRFKSILS